MKCCKNLIKISLFLNMSEDVWLFRVDEYKLYNELNKNQTKSHKPLNRIFEVQHGTLTRDNGNLNENGVVARNCVLMQRKWIQTIKIYDQKPNKTAQTV